MRLISLCPSLTETVFRLGKSSALVPCPKTADRNKRETSSTRWCREHLGDWGRRRRETAACSVRWLDYARRMALFEVDGDLLDQPVEVIVNAWNRNIIPWWLLLPQGVSGAIKKRGGTEPFREVARLGPIPLGDAVLTSAGRLPFRGIIHVAGIDMLWRSSEPSIRGSARSALAIVNRERFASVAFPIIGAGSGGMSEDKARAILLDELGMIPTEAQVFVVRYGKR